MRRPDGAPSHSAAGGTSAPWPNDGISASIDWRGIAGKDGETAMPFSKKTPSSELARLGRAKMQ